MKVIAQRIWHEPAVCIGLLVSIALVIITLISGDAWDLSTIAGVIAPFASSLGIRQLVTPTEQPAKR